VAGAFAAWAASAGGEAAGAAPLISPTRAFGYLRSRYFREWTRQPFCSVMLPPRYAILTFFPPSSFFARFGIPNLSESSASGRTESGFGVPADAAANVAETIAAIAALLRAEFKNFIFYMFTLVYNAKLRTVKQYGTVLLFAANGVGPAAEIFKKIY